MRKITVTQGHLAAALTEWDRRYAADPSQFEGDETTDPENKFTAGWLMDRVQEVQDGA